VPTGQELEGLRAESAAVVRLQIGGRSFDKVEGLGGLSSDETLLHATILESLETRHPMPADLNVVETGHDTATPDGEYLAFLGEYKSSDGASHYAIAEGWRGLLAVQGDQLQQVCEDAKSPGQIAVTGSPTTPLGDYVKQIRSSPQPASPEVAPQPPVTTQIK
jgi:hypothetical protein